jgi:hypothetical protein
VKCPCFAPRWVSDDALLELSATAVMQPLTEAKARRKNRAHRVISLSMRRKHSIELRRCQRRSASTIA